MQDSYNINALAIKIWPRIFVMLEPCLRIVKPSGFMLSCLFRGKQQFQVCEPNQMSKQRHFGSVALVCYKLPSGLG